MLSFIFGSAFFLALILHIETATQVCSIALAKDGKLLSLKEENKGFSHAENITVFMEIVLSASGKKIQQLDAVAVSAGPGSYTGLRIGASAAKGLCFALDKPLIAVPTLESLAVSFLNDFNVPNGAVLVPMIDARRMEVYCAVYDDQLREIEKTSAKVIDAGSFDNLPDGRPVYFFGDGAAKCKTMLEKTNRIFVDNIFPSGASMIKLAEEKFSNKTFENVSLFEPAYLKEFYTPK